MSLTDRLNQPKLIQPGTWEALCPAHDDSHASLVVWENGRNGYPTVFCRAGCDWRDIKKELGLPTTGKTAPPPDGCTLEEYAAARRLDVEQLRSYGLETVTRKGVKAVSIPYLNAAGSVLETQFRVGLTGVNRLQWNKDAHVPKMYGLDRLATFDAENLLVVVEGPSDAHTMWHHGYQAVALTSATAWNATVEAHLEGFTDIVVLLEPDKGGDTILESVMKSDHIDNIRVVRYSAVGAKDASDIHMRFRGPDLIVENLVEAATPASDIRDEMHLEAVADAWSRCAHLAVHPNILDLVDKTVRDIGLVGERTNVLIIYLAVVSRLLPKPLSVAFKGVSSSGKSFTADTVVSLFPDDDVITSTGASEKAIIYSDNDYRNKTLYMIEAAGFVSDLQDYFVRTLLSEGHISYEVTVKDNDGEFHTQQIRKEGPTGLIVATTRTKLHEENETRVWSLTADDSDSQTRAVMDSIARLHTGESGQRDESLLDAWHALSEWLRLTGPYKVVIPYASIVVDQIPPKAVRLRRDTSLLLGTIAAHCVLHAALRDIDAEGRLIASRDDYETIYDLVYTLMAENIEATVPKSVRDTVIAAQAAGATSKLTDQKAGDLAGSVTVKQVLAESGLSDRSAVARRIRRAVDDGFLERTPEGRGKAMHVWLGDDLPDDIAVLPDPENVFSEVGQPNRQLSTQAYPSDSNGNRKVGQLGSPYSEGIPAPMPLRGVAE